MITKRLLTLTDVAKLLGIPKRTFYRMCVDGRFDVAPMPNVRPRRWRIEDVDAWRNRTASAA